MVGTVDGEVAGDEGLTVGVVTGGEVDETGETLGDDTDVAVLSGEVADGDGGALVEGSEVMMVDGSEVVGLDSSGVDGAAVAAGEVVATLDGGDDGTAVVVSASEGCDADDGAVVPESAGDGVAVAVGVGEGVPEGAVEGSDDGLAVLASVGEASEGVGVDVDGVEVGVEDEGVVGRELQ